MEYLQYLKNIIDDIVNFIGFKPYYKWNTFNTTLGQILLKKK